MNSVYLAADFGAGSGRVVAGTISTNNNGKTLTVQELHRFNNRIVRLGDYLHWDFPALYADMKEGLAKAASKQMSVKSIGIDTWGVDFGLIDKLGNLVGNPVCYRDTHTDQMPRIFCNDHSTQEHYEETGTQMMAINTLFRLMAMKSLNDPKLKIAHKLLFMPDLFSYFLCGYAANEYTIASTSEMLDARKRNWSKQLIDYVDVDESLFCPIIMPGTTRGTLLPHIAAETGLNPDTKIVAVGSHDTASAVFAIDEDYQNSRAAFLSSGTWSLFGVVVPQPILTPEARQAGFTNEGAVGGQIRFLTNITGLWILQRLVAKWKAEGHDCEWGTLIDEAEHSTYDGIIDVDDPIFQSPDNMDDSIASYCRQHGLTPPENRGDFVFCVCRSLAKRYKKAVEELNRLLPHPLEKLRIFGGGANNRLLTRLTAAETGLEVITGPIEATAIGNILVQAIADGAIISKKEITEIIEK